MSNKSRLETNNTNLQSVLQAVQGLPNVDDVKRGTYVWKKLSAKGGTFLDYVVADNASAYPDGGTKDGYWYEKVVEGKAGVDFGEVAITSNTRTFEVEHNLGVVPTIAYVIGYNNPQGTSAYSCIQIISNSKIYADSMYGDVYGITATGGTSPLTKSSFSTELTAQKIKFAVNTQYFGSGRTYNWFAIA